MTKQDAPTTTDALRVEFEAWARELPGHTPNYIKRFPKEAGAAGGKYFDPVTELAWQAWQAARASSAAAQPWTNVKDALPSCRDDKLYLGVNSNGYAGVFNSIADIAGDVHCMYETAEERVDVMSGLALWQEFTLPAPPAKPADTGEAPDA